MARPAERTALGLAPLAAAALLAACGTKPPMPPEEPLIASLAGRTVAVDTSRRVEAKPEQAIAAYQQFLKALPAGTGGTQRAEAMRRLADLEMDRVDEAVGSGQASGSAADYKTAVASYQRYLKDYPNDPGNHRVLYQLARAQELGGDIDAALRTLTQLVATYPEADHAAEAQFRRGELLFSAGRHADAEAAFSRVLAARPETLFHERALYMHGWSQFKRGRLEEALGSFFQVLDRKIGAAEPGTRAALTRADRELLEDTFRVTSLSLQNLQGAATIAGFMDTPVRQSYEPMVHSELAELYLKQERTKDAADTLAAFAQRRPLHPQAPVLLSRVIGIHEKAGFATLALAAKKDFVGRYGAASALRSSNPEVWREAQPLVKAHLTELARHHHALAQKNPQGPGRADDVREAARWYGELLAAFPDDAEAQAQRFLLAELLFEDRRWAEAATEYERVAYAEPRSPRAAEAGYAVLVAHAKLRPADADTAALAGWKRQAVERGLRFAKAFPSDARAAEVLTDTADHQFALGDIDGAGASAKQVLALQPAATDAQRRVAWTIVAHGAFDRAAWADAERGYREVLALTPAGAAPRAALDERLAAAIYKQGESARAGGQLQAAVGHFERAAALGGAGAAGIPATAQYDAAAARLALKDWAGGARQLEDFRQRHPQHPLAAEIPAKLAAAYLELQRWGPAAGELERLSASAADATAARDALWQAAELHAKAGDARSAGRVYERYVQQHPRPLEPAVEARQRLADLARERGDAKAQLAWTQAVQQADATAGAERTDRTRTLGARAAMGLAEPVFAAARSVRLVEPLQKNLKLKKERLDTALQTAARLSEYGVAEAVTAAAFHSGALYQEFGQALITSERPKKLKKAEREQYDVMLEEQAFPFEEKAIELHAANARRTRDGVWTEWVQRSFEALAKLQPARWARTERGASTRPLAELEAQASRDAAAWTALGVARRQAGRFADADAAYQQALAQQPAHADALLSRAVLLDLYHGDRNEALALYQRYLAVQPGGDANVTRWVAALQRDLGAPVAANTPEAKR